MKSAKIYDIILPKNNENTAPTGRKDNKTMTKDEKNIILEELSEHPVMVTSGALDVFNLIYNKCLERGVDISAISFGDMCDIICEDVMARTEE